MFIGNKKTVTFLKKSLESGRIGQSYLFVGPESVGKYTLATLFAESLIEGKNMKDAAGTHVIPDLIVVKPEIEEKRAIKKEKEIKVEHIREAQKKLSLFPYSGKYKVLIINDAHKMSLSAQNSLLKILEEPNKTSILILVTHDSAQILPTIQSRCQTITFSLASGKEILSLLGNKKNAEEIALFSMGRPGLTLTLLNDAAEVKKKQEELKRVLAFQSYGITERFKIAEKMASDPLEATRTFNFWTWIIREKTLAGIKDDFFSFETLEKIKKIIGTMQRTNANVRLAIENLFLDL